MKAGSVLPTGLCLLGLMACIPAIPNLHPKLFLYPVSGPVSGHPPAAAITASTSGISSGSISFQLPSGERCQGPWAPLPAGQLDDSLSASWDLVYGRGYYVANVLGSKWHGTANITGDRGTVFQLAFYRSSVKDSPLLGVARDTDGNVYKVTQ